MQQTATVLKKEILKQKFGDDLMPRHDMVCTVRFSLDANEKGQWAVPVSEFEKIEVGTQGTLLLRNNHFVAFETNADGNDA